jgi:hypothetical protein
MFEYDLFLSFSSKDIERVRPIWQRLASSGLRVFWADETLRLSAGRNFVSTIQEALVNSKDFALYWTENAAGSSWVEEEYQAFYSQCYMRDKKTRRLLVVHDVPRHEQSLPTFLRQLQAVRSIDDLVEILRDTRIDATKSENVEFDRLVHNLRADLGRAQSQQSVKAVVSKASPVFPKLLSMAAHPDKDLPILLVSDRSASTHRLKAAYVSYPGGYGPSSERRGLKVRRGTLLALVKWVDVFEVEFVHINELSSGSVKYNYTVRVTMLGGDSQMVELQPDWNMSAGATGLLFGITELGETSIRFTDIATINVVDALTV